MNRSRNPDQILDALCHLPPARFELLIARLAIPYAHLSAQTAAQAIRATEILRYLEAQGQLERLLKELAASADGAEGYSPYPLSLVEELDRLTRQRHTPPDDDTPLSTNERQQRIDAIVGELRRQRSPGINDVVVGVRLTRVVGKGNFGVVWQGIHETTGHVRAVKVFDSDRLGLELALVHFRRGVKAMIRLREARSRPSSVIELFDDEDTRLAFSMPYLEGGDIRHLDRRGWALNMKLRVFRTVCEAVGFAHDNGIIHRDIKPTNIVMTANGEPVLTDFDIADLLFAHTMSAMAAGTDYAAPEQRRKDDLKARSAPSADIYSLGRLLYYLLLERDPEPIVQRVPELDDLALQPKGLVRIIRKCMMYHPHLRYASVAELLRDVDRYRVAPTAIGLGLPGWASRARARGVGALVVASVGLAAVSFARCSEPPKRDEVRSSEMSARVDSFTADASAQPDKKRSQVDMTDQTDGPCGRDDVCIGSYFSEEGTQELFGLSSYHGAKLAVDQINARAETERRLADGRHRNLRLRRRNDRGREELARLNVQELINLGVIAVVGEVVSLRSIAGGKVCQAQGVPMISPSSTSEEFKIGGYVFRACFSNNLQGAAMADFMYHNLERTKAAVLAERGVSYSRELADAFEDKLRELGGHVVAKESYSGQNPDQFGKLLSTLAGAVPRPQAIYIPGYYHDVLEFARLTSMHPTWSVPMLLGGDGWESLHSPSERFPSGIEAYFTSHFHYGAKGDDQNVKDFVRAYRAMCNDTKGGLRCKEGDTPNALAALAYDAVMLVWKAVKAAPVGKNLALWRTNVRDAIRNTRNFPGITGNISIGPTVEKPVVVVKIDPEKGPVYVTTYNNGVTTKEAKKRRP